MIVTKRHQSPRAQNYRGTWPGLGAVPVPNYENCFATDSACVARNAVLGDAWNAAMIKDLWQTNNKGPMPVGWMTAGDTPARQAEIASSYNAALAPAAAPVSGGKVTFTSSRGSNTLQVGDTWLVSITGATPGKQVTAKVGTDVTPMGTTDASGNFSLAGAARTADAGAWNETWAVGGVPSGAVSFTVQPAVTPEGKQVINSSGAGSGTGTGGTGGTGGGTGAGSGTGSDSAKTGFDLSASFNCTDPTTCWFGFPKWAVLGAAGVALFFFGGGRGR